MMDTKRCIVASAFAFFFAFPLSQVFAAEDQQSGTDKIRQNLTNLLPGLNVSDITPTPAPGLYEVLVGQRVLYVTGDGRYLIQGNLIDLKEKENLTEPRMNALKAKAVAEVGEDNMVIFGPKDAKHTITVFTDIDCGYCRKLHEEMEDYNREGIRIRYLFYPRAGLKSASYRKAVSVWCADDRNVAMTRSKAGEELEDRKCTNPVQAHYELGDQVGVRGTPALVLESGKMIPGYVPPERLSAILNQSN
ncbi:MAG: DsbC family protein [Gammaproteobacteria bacterium]|nr:DsbC family protein [Gammaproteobacteria bacterium]